MEFIDPTKFYGFELELDGLGSSHECWPTSKLKCRFFCPILLKLVDVRILLLKLFLISGAASKWMRLSGSNNPWGIFQGFESLEFSCQGLISMEVG